MVPVAINSEMIENAKRRAEEQGVLKNSFMEGKGNFVGYLGEEIFLKEFGGDRTNDHHHDVVYKGKKMEIKTKNTTSYPRHYYMCSVSAFNPLQESDYYVFCRVNQIENIGWICGFYDVNKFKMDAKFYRKGEFDPDNEYYVKSDCWSLPISRLREEI
jgi:hypothetical protein